MTRKRKKKLKMGQGHKFPRGSVEHREAARLHAYVRLKNRYGIHDLLAQRVLLVRHEELITSGRARLLGRAPDGSLIYEVFERKYGGWLYPCWRPGLRLVATYLTRPQAYWRLGLEFLL